MMIDRLQSVYIYRDYKRLQEGGPRGQPSVKGPVQPSRRHRKLGDYIKE